MTTTPPASAHDAGDLEFELRVLPGVVSVGVVPPDMDRSARVTVVVRGAGAALHDEVAQLVQRHQGGASVEIVDLAT